MKEIERELNLNREMERKRREEWENDNLEGWWNENLEEREKKRNYILENLKVWA